MGLGGVVLALGDEGSGERLAAVTLAALTGEFGEPGLAALVAECASRALGGCAALLARLDGAELVVIGRAGGAVGADRVPVTSGTVEDDVLRSGALVRRDGIGDGLGLLAGVVSGQKRGCAVGMPVWVTGELWGCVLVAGSDGLPADAEECVERLAALLSAGVCSTVAMAQGGLRDWVVVLDRDGRIVEVNDVFCEIVGRPSGELVGTRSPFAFAGECEEPFAGSCGSPLVRGLIAGDGRAVPVLISVSGLLGEEGPGERAVVVRAVSPASEQAAVEVALRELAVASARGGLGERALAQLAAERVAGLLSAPAVSVVRFDREWLRVVGHAGRLPRPKARRRSEHTIAARVARTGRPARLEDQADLAAEYARAAATLSLSAAVAVPVHVDGVGVGMRGRDEERSWWLRARDRIRA